jgi:anti-repressor protein
MLSKITNSTYQTPIEIALGIDGNGNTTARKLYDFLELAKYGVV